MGHRFELDLFAGTELQSVCKNKCAIQLRILERHPQVPVRGSWALATRTMTVSDQDVSCLFVITVTATIYGYVAVYSSSSSANLINSRHKNQIQSLNTHFHSMCSSTKQTDIVALSYNTIPKQTKQFDLRGT